MKLAEQQLQLRELIKGRTTQTPADAYLASVSGSPGLGMIREIALWWRAFLLEGFCPLTSRLLKRLGGFDESVASFFDNGSVSPYREQAGQQFLESLEADPRPLVQSMAQFELALIRAKSGDPRTYLLKWDRNPDLIIQALLSGKELPEKDKSDWFLLEVSSRIDELVRCEKLRGH